MDLGAVLKVRVESGRIFALTAGKLYLCGEKKVVKETEVSLGM